MLPTPTTSLLDFNLVYEPAEDTFLLLDLFEEDLSFITARFPAKAATPIVVELGTGSGIVTTFIHKHILPHALHMATDLNPHACAACVTTWTENHGQRHRLDTLRGSLATPLRPRLVDVLVFNPPYVPDETVPAVPLDGKDENGEDTKDDRWLDLALLGGDDGMEVTWQVLDDLDTILSDRGVAYILFCKRNKPEQVAAEMARRGWQAQRVGERKAGWEVLSVWRFSKSLE